jgi:hypothetical protein
MHCTWTLLQWEELTEFGSLHKLILRGFKFLAVKLKIVIPLETPSGIIQSPIAVIFKALELCLRGVSHGDLSTSYSNFPLKC